jgi:2-C-methyl-D-erythritol 2,4-cyclodiphosphate synthase
VSDLRVGLGVDAHALAEGVPLVLGGVVFEHPRGLAGHSDGDVLAHALIDALLGAAGLGDIGSLFPSGDERWHGANSLDLLREAYGQVTAAGWALVNADCVLIGEEPRIAPHRDEMRARLAAALGVEVERVNVRATTTDRLGFTGRGEGLAAEAVALLERRETA